MKIGIIVPFLFFFIYGIFVSQKQRRAQRCKCIKNTMVSLVEGIQRGRLLPMDISVSVSDEMREKLCYPLTREIIHMICVTKEQPQLSRFIYRCVDCSETKNEINGTVEICIDYVNEALNLDLHYNFVQIKLKWKMAPGTGWYVDSLEH